MAKLLKMITITIPLATAESMRRAASDGIAYQRARTRGADFVREYESARAAFTAAVADGETLNRATEGLLAEMDARRASAEKNRRVLAAHAMVAGHADIIPPCVGERGTLCDRHADGEHRRAACRDGKKGGAS